MGWITDGAPTCEGYVALLFADGQQGSGTTSTGVFVWPDGDIKREELRPYAEVMAWQVQCDCGWRGITRPLDQERPEDMDPDHREPTPEREDQLAEEWRAHIRPVIRLEEVRDLADELAEVTGRLETAVRAAWAAGVDWSALGRAVGMTARDAERRYSTEA